MATHFEAIIQTGKKLTINVVPIVTKFMNIGHNKKSIKIKAAKIYGRVS